MGSGTSPMGRGGGGARAAQSIDNMTVAEAQQLTRAQLANMGEGHIVGVHSRWNGDRLEYATLEKETEVSAANAMEGTSGRDLSLQFENYMQDRFNKRVTGADIDVTKEGDITLWDANGNRDFFRVTGGTRITTTYIEPNTRHGSTLNSKVYVRRTQGRDVKLKFEYVGHKDY